MQGGDNFSYDVDPNELIDFEKEELKRKNMELHGALTGAGFNDPEENNIVQYRLETDRILERIEHFLKGDVVKFDERGQYFAEPTKKIIVSLRQDPKTKTKYYVQEFKEDKKSSERIKEVLVKIVSKDLEGNEFEIDVQEGDSVMLMKKLRKMNLKHIGYKYVSVVDDSKKLLNDYGVAFFMRILSSYVTKETFLSWYKDDRIYEILSDLGNELADFVYCNYEKIGMDTKFKESAVKLMVLNVLHIVESCYRRSLGGNEARGIITKSIISQSSGSGFPGGNAANLMQKRKFWKPSSW